MTTIAGFKATGRRLLGPASDLHELEDPNGLKHAAIVFHEQWRNHPAITDALGVVKGYLESPLVTGLVELVEHVPANGAFLYPTGKVWSVAEVVQGLADRGTQGGVRAGLELMYTAGQILTEGAEAGEAQGVYSHGGLTPRRIVIKGDGQVMVIGYGLPQVEILEYHADRRQIPSEDSFRYCPPERLESKPEDLSSDLFGLSLVAFELMTGKPVYDGLVNDIRQQAARGEGSRRLFRFREVLPEPVRNLLAKALRPDSMSRYLSGEDFLSDVHTLLADRKVPGVSLHDLMADLQSDQKRVGGIVQQGRTQMVEADELRAQLSEEDEIAQESLGRSSSDVWRPAQRRRVAPRGRPAEPELEPVEAVAPPMETPVEAPPREAPVEEADSEVESANAETGSGHIDAEEPVWGQAKRRVRRARSDEKLAEPQPVSMDELASESVVPPKRRRIARTTESQDDGVPAPPVIPPTTPALPNASVSSQETSSDTSQPAASPPPPVVPGVVATPKSADDLLQRIRGAGDSTPMSSNMANEATAIFAKEQAMEVVVGADDDSDSATQMMTPDQLRARLAEEIEVDNPQTPKPVSPKNTGSGSTRTVRVVLPDGREITESVSLETDTASLVSSWIGQLVPLPLDQSGILKAWFRLEQKGNRIAAQTTISELEDSPIHVVRVPGETRTVEIVVVSKKGQDVRFSNPVSTVVPVSSLIRHLRDWLVLPPADWELVVDGQFLGPHMILDDVIHSGTISVQLRVANP